MSVILPLFLMLLAFAGGVVLAYVFMDTPRRQAKAKESKLNQQMQRAREYYEELVEFERGLNARAASLESARPNWLVEKERL